MQTSLVRSACTAIARRAAWLNMRYYCAQPVQNIQAPHADGEEKAFAPHITQLVDQIGKLTLIEVADLNSCLKKTLNIQDAPMMPMMGMSMAAPVQAAEEEDSESKPQIQSLFAVKIEKFEDSKKIALIKEVKKMTEGMNLVQAKKFVESAPVVVKEELTKDEAEAMKKTLEESGASVVIS